MSSKSEMPNAIHSEELGFLVEIQCNIWYNALIKQYIFHSQNICNNEIASIALIGEVVQIIKVFLFKIERDLS